MEFYSRTPVENKANKLRFDCADKSIKKLKNAFFTLTFDLKNKYCERNKITILQIQILLVGNAIQK